MVIKKKEKTVKEQVIETKKDVKKSAYKKLGYRTKKSVNDFNNELKKAVNTAFMAAFGFLIALTWRDVISTFVKSISQKSPLQGELVSAIIITLICVLGILIMTAVFKKREQKK